MEDYRPIVVRDCRHASLIINEQPGGIGTRCLSCGYIVWRAT